METTGIDINVVRGDIEVLLSKVERPGADKLMVYLHEVGFYTQPASIKYHCAYQGGLAEHSFNVYMQLEKLSIEFPINYLTKESIILTSLMHDLCKAGAYLEVEEPKEKDKNQFGFAYKWNKEHPDGHGVLSAERLKEFIELQNFEEAMIRYHMGPWYSLQYNKRGEYPLGKVLDTFNILPPVKMLYFADELASLAEA